MKSNFKIRNILGVNSVQNKLTADLAEIDTLTPISQANVVLERRLENKPAFIASASLAIPGPDIHASAVDHTWAAAWMKVQLQLRSQLLNRKSTQTRRKKLRKRTPVKMSRS